MGKKKDQLKFLGLNWSRNPPRWRCLNFPVKLLAPNLGGVKFILSIGKAQRGLSPDWNQMGEAVRQ